MATLLALKKDLEQELDLMNEFALVNLKSYQVWYVTPSSCKYALNGNRHHRLLLMSLISPEHPTSEIDYIHLSLLPDPKNYHTWAYLHWLYSHFSSLGRISESEWAEEQRWCDEMLRTDGRNNSAWSWRWFLRMARPGAKGSEDEGKEESAYVAPLSAGHNSDSLNRYTLKAIHLIPHNVSAWNYLRGYAYAQLKWTTADNIT